MRILLVEDDPDDAATVRAHLGQTCPWPYTLDRTGRLDEALALLDARPFDVVLLDLDLPDAVGPETVSRLSEAHADVPIAVISGDDDAEGALAVEGADAYISKSQLGAGNLARTLLYATERGRALRQFRTLVEQSPDAIVVVSGSDAVRFANDAACALFGRPAHELLGKVFPKLVQPGDGGGEVTVMRPDGRTRAAEMSRSEIVWRGRPANIFTLRDRTEHLLAEERFRALMDGAPDALLLTDARGALVAVNRRTEELLGYSQTDLLDLHLDDLVVRVDGPSGQTHEAVRSDGSRMPVELSTSRTPSGGPGGPQTVVSLRDISDRIALDRKLREREEQLRQAQKMEAIGQLAGGIAHDFNNLLTAIISFCGFVHDDLPANDPRLDDLRSALAAADRASALTRQLLLFSRQRPMVTRPCDANEQLRSLEDLLRRTLGEDVELVLDLTGDEVFVLADPAHLDQVIVNLAVNARDAMPRGGALRISTLVEAAPEPDDEGVGRRLRLAVEDSGEGMDAATMHHAFEPFFTTKEIGKGTGLGLATCYGIVQQLGGTITLDSALGEGTRVIIRLPVDERDRASEHPTGPHGVLDGTETVLVIEDDEAVRHIATRVLARHGYQVLTARDGPTGLDAFMTHAGEIDLVFSDVVLTRGNGFDVAAAIREREPQLPILLTTGYTDRRSFPEGPCPFPILWKPYRPADLVRAIREHLDGRGLSETSSRSTRPRAR